MTKVKSIKEIKEILQEISDPNDSFLHVCLQDERKGVIKLVEQWNKAYQQKEKLKQKWYEMTSYEKSVYKEGFHLIAGVDEVGRGPLAGPVVAAAVILPTDFMLLGLDDSKKINESKRNQFYDQIKESAVAIGVGIINHDVIDEINIYEATKLAMIQAIEQMGVRPDYLLIDAMKLPLSVPQQSIVKGDAKSVSISAASIMAKVTRDRLMYDYDKQYPQYGFKNNMGYGTKEHLDALKTYGPTPLHRLSFAPVKDLSRSN